ncbi:MAG: hypothetical protein JJ934_03310 [Pseudomonadales bacterium]|nr:hypothetical protein [Pseudomonadales bacterium]
MSMSLSGNFNVRFHANVWEWRALCSLMHSAGHDVPDAWLYNEYQGLSSDELCQSLADKISAYVDRQPGEENFVLSHEQFKLDANHLFAPCKEMEHIAYSVHRSEVFRFIAFLRCCRGFVIG